jgi:uncharacterized protein (TIGR03437 family)
LTEVPTRGAVRAAIVNDTADWILYETATDASATLHAVNVTTGRDFVLAQPSVATFQASISNDGRTVVFIDGGKAYISRPDGFERRLLADLDEGVIHAVLAGFGRFAVVSTGLGRLLKINVATGAAEELIARTPSYAVASAAIVPGSLLSLYGSGLARESAIASSPLPLRLGGVEVRLDGQPVPLLSVSPQQILLQVPFELPVNSGAVEVYVEDYSVFEGGRRTVALVNHAPEFLRDGALTAAHQDFGALVTRLNPARAGEIVHLYAVGLGAVVPAVQTGVITPAAPLARVQDRFVCSTPEATEVQVLFAGLAPVLIGIYQVDLRLPAVVPLGEFLFSCEFPDDPETRLEYGSGFIYTAP